MLGRSDGVLYVPIHSSPRQSFNSSHRNPGGIRFGSAEIYEVLDLCFSSRNAEHVVLDYLAVGQRTDGGTDERVVLFIKLPPGQDLSPTFEARIKSEIRSRRSPRHVPARVYLLFNIAIVITKPFLHRLYKYQIFPTP
jgi:acetoacetyl-CoA synthetase